MDLYRVVVHDPGARKATVPGHPLYIPSQGSGRIDDAKREYKVWYCAPDPLTAIVEKFRNLKSWSPAMLQPPPAATPGSRYALARMSIEPTLCDMDDPHRLVLLDLRPSRVATSDRATTQSWARDVYEEGTFDGIVWWCSWNADRQAIGVWNLSPAQPVHVLDLTSDLIAEAAELVQVFIDGF